ncbi:MAG: lysoplasmalogenase [Deltaproteobacteria bacterium]|nr:lysoplasmalogenase [Deltaproteobacteria bacterium]
MSLAIVVVALALLFGLLVEEKKQRGNRILWFKAPLSCLFVLVASVQPHPLPTYFHWVLVGLVLGLVGDVCLALPGERAFRAGLVAFLAGHVLYIVAFASLTRSNDWISIVALVIVGASVAVFLWLRPRLGPMTSPVGAYVIVISVMLIAAWAAYCNPAIHPMGGAAIFVGALLFYLSDLFVARDRFVHRQFLNRLVGLPFYYAGQFLIAFSVGLVG